MARNLSSGSLLADFWLQRNSLFQEEGCYNWSYAVLQKLTCLTIAIICCHMLYQQTSKHKLFRTWWDVRFKISQARNDDVGFRGPGCPFMEISDCSKLIYFMASIGLLRWTYTILHRLLRDSRLSKLTFDSSRYLWMHAISSELPSTTFPNMMRSSLQTSTGM